MRNIAIIAWYLGNFLFCQYAFAYDNSNWRQLLFMGNFDVSERNSRLIIANGFLSSLQSLDAYVPNLKPSEKQWLDSERKSFSTLSGEALNQKMYRLSSSTEFQLETLKENLKGAISGLKCIKQKDVKLDREIYCWAHVNLILTDDSTFNDAIVRLNNSTKVIFSPPVRKQFLLSNEMNSPWSGYKLLGRSIQKNIVVPYLQSH